MMPKSGAVRFALLATVVAADWAAAATIDEDALVVTRRDGRYSLVAEAHLRATPASIYAVLMEYDNNAYGRISSVYKESRYLEPASDGTPLVYTRMEGCFWFACLSLCRTERLESIEPTWIKSYALPERSNFKHSTSEWELKPDGQGGTNMVYRLEMEPDFRVPPLIGPLFLKRTLEKGGVNAVRRIERLARIREGLPVEYVQPPRGSRPPERDRAPERGERTDRDARNERNERGDLDERRERNEPRSSCGDKADPADNARQAAR